MQTSFPMHCLFGLLIIGIGVGIEARKCASSEPRPRVSRPDCLSGEIHRFFNNRRARSVPLFRNDANSREYWFLVCYLQIVEFYNNKVGRVAGIGADWSTSIEKLADDKDGHLTNFNRLRIQGVENYMQLLGFIRDSLAVIGNPTTHWANGARRADTRLSLRTTLRILQAVNIERYEDTKLCQPIATSDYAPQAEVNDLLQAISDLQSTLQI